MTANTFRASELKQVPQYDDIIQAAKRIKPFAHRTPVLTSSAINEMFGAEFFFKAENLQKMGAFKFRGACNSVFSLSKEQAAKGVLAHSSGNHAQALALAAKLRGIKATIVMPTTTVAVKRRAVAGYGAQIVDCEPTQTSREETTQKVKEQTGAHFIHPYNDPRVIAGQGTSALELLQEHSELDMILVPVGGGGLASGTCIAAAGANPRIRVIAVEPEGADDAWRSLRDGKIYPSKNPKTVADGLHTSLGDITFAALRKYLDSVVLVSEQGIVDAMRLIWERMKIVVEPSAAVPVAALLENKIRFRDQRIGVIISGGNVDLGKLPWQADN